jgi:toxin ParE1/3/4
MGTEVFHLAPGHRRFRFESHHIYYTPEPYGVLIRDLFHVAQDIRASLFR